MHGFRCDSQLGFQVQVFDANAFPAVSVREAEWGGSAMPFVNLSIAAAPAAPAFHVQYSTAPLQSNLTQRNVRPVSLIGRSGLGWVGGGQVPIA